MKEMYCMRNQADKKSIQGKEGGRWMTDDEKSLSIIPPFHLMLHFFISVAFSRLLFISLNYVEQNVPFTFLCRLPYEQCMYM
jgi:hypothetical protein